MLSHASVSRSAGSAKTSKRVGRGNGSGKGTYSGRGCKGQGSRTGKGKFNVAFEGGQTPLVRRMPKKRGFTAFNQTQYEIVNVSTLQTLADAGVTTIDTEVLFNKGIIRHKAAPIKLLGNGDLKASVTVRVHAASDSAKQKIEAASGKVELI